MLSRGTGEAGPGDAKRSRFGQGVPEDVVNCPRGPSNNDSGTPKSNAWAMRVAMWTEARRHFASANIVRRSSERSARRHQPPRHESLLRACGGRHRRQHAPSASAAQRLPLTSGASFAFASGPWPCVFVAGAAYPAERYSPSASCRRVRRARSPLVHLNRSLCGLMHIAQGCFARCLHVRSWRDSNAASRRRAG